MKGHIVGRVLPGSIAEELGIEKGDKLLGIRSVEVSTSMMEEEFSMEEELSVEETLSMEERNLKEASFDIEEAFLMEDDSADEEHFMEIEDIFDYQYLIQDTAIEILIEKPYGEQWLLDVDKEQDEDLGIEFENGLMDEYRHCRNKCVFCFIDQMPPGMRETLYFKDDDSRLSFLQGNYVTLTNMSDYDIDRICKYHLSPINISFHTMNPELRCRMLNNRFAGEALKKVDILYAAGIRMNGQIVLCKGLNDGRELEYSIEQLMRYLPNLESVSVVPVGLTKYREGLYPLEPFTKEDAVQVINTIEKYQELCFRQYHTHFIHASDEWYILADREMPEEQRYDGYLQLENGVGMMRLLMDEFDDAMEQRGNDGSAYAAMGQCGNDGSVHITMEQCGNGSKACTVMEQCELAIATGRLAYPYLQRMADRMMAAYPGLYIHVYAITNDFFGERITVSGLITGQDLLKQLKNRPLGRCLFLPENILRSGEDVFLDDFRVGDLEKALQAPINIVKSSGYDFVEKMLSYYYGASL